MQNVEKPKVMYTFNKDEASLLTRGILKQFTDRLYVKAIESGKSFKNTLKDEVSGLRNYKHSDLEKRFNEPIIALLCNFYERIIKLGADEDAVEHALNEIWASVGFIRSDGNS